MKKLKLFLSLVSIISIILLAGCKSTPVSNNVDPLSIIDEGHSFYISAPKIADPELFKNVLSRNVTGLSESNINQLTGYLDRLYAGIDFNKKGTSIQASVESTFPRKYAPKVLTEKNGWSKTKLEVENPFSESKSKTNTYEQYTQDAIRLAFPADNIICLTDSQSSMESMIYNYDSYANLIPDESFDDLISPEYKIPEEIYQWIAYSDNTIKFYTTNPSVLIYEIIGTNIDLKLNTIKGSIVQSEKSENLYNMDFVFEFQSAKFMKAGKTLLMIGLNLNNNDINKISDTEFEIHGIEIKKERIYKLLEL